MEFPTSPPLRGRLVQRYKQFFAGVDLDEEGGIVTAHCPNPGAMLGLKEPGLTAWVSRPPDPKRKLQYTLELLELNEGLGGGLVGINTLLPNRIAAEAIAEGRIPELAGYPGLRREVKYAGDSRIDILLEDPRRPPCWVEVKNCHLLRQPGLAEFPDCRTERGVKHLKALERMAAEGHSEAVMLFVIQRIPTDRFDTRRRHRQGLRAGPQGSGNPGGGSSVLWMPSEPRGHPSRPPGPLARGGNPGNVRTQASP